MKLRLCFLFIFLITLCGCQKQKEIHMVHQESGQELNFSEISFKDLCKDLERQNYSYIKTDEVITIEFNENYEKCEIIDYYIGMDGLKGWDDQFDMKTELTINNNQISYRVPFHLTGGLSSDPAFNNQSLRGLEIHVGDQIYYTAFITNNYFGQQTYLGNNTWTD